MPMNVPDSVSSDELLYYLELNNQEIPEEIQVLTESLINARAVAMLIGKVDEIHRRRLSSIVKDLFYMYC